MGSQRVEHDLATQQQQQCIPLDVSIQCLNILFFSNWGHDLGIEDNLVWEFNLLWSPVIPVIKSWSWTLAFCALELQDMRVSLYLPMETLAFTLASTWWASFVTQLVKESACNVGELGSIPGWGRFPWRRKRLRTPAFWPGSQRVGHNWVTFTLDEISSSAFNHLSPRHQFLLLKNSITLLLPSLPHLSSTWYITSAFAYPPVEHLSSG